MMLALPRWDAPSGANRFPAIHSPEIYSMKKGPPQNRKILWGAQRRDPSQMGRRESGERFPGIHFPEIYSIEGAPAKS